MEEKINEEAAKIKNEEPEKVEDKYIWDKRQFIINSLVLIFTIIGIVIAINEINNKNVNTQIFNKNYKPHSTVYNNPRVFLKSSPHVINNSNTVNTTNIINNNGVVNSSNMVNNNINTSIINNSPVINNPPVDNNFLSKQNVQKVIDLISVFNSKKKVYPERYSSQNTANKKIYPTGWYGFAFPSKFEQNLKVYNVKYTRLNTNQNMTFNDLCRSIGKKCTTTIKVVTPNLNPDDEKCFEYKDEDVLAFCE